MNTQRSLKKDWVLTQEAFEKLLGCLNPDREAAATEYERIRQRLITFFQCNQCSCSEDRADITINRVARQILEGKKIYAGKLLNYFFGVAYKVLQEYWEESKRISTSISDVSPIRYLSQNPDEISQREIERLSLEQYIEYLEQCLQTLSLEERETIIQYYEGETSEKIKNRKILAKRLHISMNTLRPRALRIREKLAACVNSFLNPAPNS